MTSRLLPFFIIILLFGCTNPPKLEQDTSQIQKGNWMLTFDAEDVQFNIPITVESDHKIIIKNDEESIEVTSIGIKNDSIYIEMPVYQTYFQGTIHDKTTIKGTWHKPSKGEYQIPFTAVYDSTWSDQKIETEFVKYSVNFSPNTDDHYPAIGMFAFDGNRAKGTFLTETGDYRYLQGNRKNDHFEMNCFDGSHLFHFEGTFKGDSIVNGVFNSGSHWKENWTAQFNPDAELSHPDSITYSISSDPFSIQVFNDSTELVTIDQGMFNDKVTVIQLFGTWCPNCLDETLFYKEMHEAYSSQGLQIIPVAFELSTDFNTNFGKINRYKKELNLPYEMYLGGTKKAGAREKFNMLNNVSSLPTSIFIDSSGEIRRIHTGFYGPGTGEYFTRYKEDFNHFIRSLLTELEESNS